MTEESKIIKMWSAEEPLRLGIDIGSTTVKLVLLDENGDVVFSRYERHMSSVFDKVAELVDDLYRNYPGLSVKAVITGSGGLSLSKLLGIPFEQEVISCSEAVESLIPDTDVAIELGGEDAKITYYGATVEQRMNGTCAGGTGAFIDQMAVLLNTDAAGLNEAAEKREIIYPIAARCGVFAKTDIQPLINEGASLPDLAASIFQAVVNQTISGLACGRVISGKVAFLGGPLSFLPELRERFIETLSLGEDDVLIPPDGKYFVAIGAAFLAGKHEAVQVAGLKSRLREAGGAALGESKHIDPLFRNAEEYKEFNARHALATVRKKDISEAAGPVYLGLDAGSTTTKAVAIDSEKNVLYMYYKGNEGNPTEVVRAILRDLYERLPGEAYIANAVVTGYGEGLIRAGFNVDHGEIETIAHYKAAEEFLHGVDFILDIGGQDMKCMRIRDGAIYNIMLNEACSSGCGSFIEAYSMSVSMDVAEFAREGLFASAPVDLGTRCTVFMNSKVKQAQKEGSTIGDISAGLSYSIIKNALYKVIKLRNPDDAGKRIVVQGGTFLNDSVLRSIERIVGRNVVRPDISGHMGAFGAAIIALENSDGERCSSILAADMLDGFQARSRHARCGGCENNCLLTINKFSNGDRFITGNRCEKGAGETAEGSDVPNLYGYKFRRLFAYEPLPEDEAPRGEIGIPRVLNMYENYPFWFTFFTRLGFRVVLSPASNKAMYEKGMDTISSDTVCYPAKLVHGHIRWLLEHGVKRIFYPSINYELYEDDTANNHYNCPIVATYPEVISGNMDDLVHEYGAELIHPFLPYDDDARLAKRLAGYMGGFGIGEGEVRSAVAAGREEDLAFKADIRSEGKRALAVIKKKKLKAVVLSGRPYHLDPEVNHGIDTLITSFGLSVLTEDSVADTVKIKRPTRVLDQWMYHSRLYRAAEFVGKHDDIELIQLTSFGCGLDAVTTDQVEDILSMKNKLYTLLKIDEGSNLGAAKIRVRSLKAAMAEREKNGIHGNDRPYTFERLAFTEEMRKGYTILIPQMSPIHFDFVAAAISSAGYRTKLLPPVDVHAVDEGLKYVNNDACYPTIMTLGQVISYLKSGECDLGHTAIFMSQTGGGCRASNYIALLRKALKELGMEQIPVVSANMVGLEKNPGFSITPKLAVRVLMACIYGDTLMRILYATRPYEKNKGDADKLAAYWTHLFVKEMPHMRISKYRKYLADMVNDFDKIEIRSVLKPKVGVVGEILVKYHPNANNDIVGIIEDEGGEAVVLDLLDFFLYGMYSKNFNHEMLSGTKKAKLLNNLAIGFMEWFRKPARKALRSSSRFHEPLRIDELAKKAQCVTSLGNQCGEGWLLTGEMVELIDSGVENIVCMQPFACLPNHVVGKGMMKPLRKYNSLANIAAIDYDPGASDVNQLNRIKLMMATAHKNLEKKVTQLHSENDDIIEKA
ncbi:MAG: 2-hydroxyacyl-CoA dehydratase [Clostridiales Family XIII bacterium]|jgi:predicted CoA-substrate-specific enzyme activase|nr:2-hydroxyacyl-CoA dehydratase [Clostridiales Family XIII bacterium]